MEDFIAQAMGRALEQTRAGDLTGATRTIQSALGDAATENEPKPPAKKAAARHDTNAIPDAEIIEDHPGPQPRPVPATPDRRTRKPLSDVVASLSALKGGLPGGLGRTSPPPATPPGARYERHRYTSPHGNRAYTIYVPSALPDGAQGLVLMLHGCTQDADDFARGTAMNDVAERNGLVVVYPEQGRAENAQGCWNWFRPGDQRAGSGEPEILAGLARSIAQDHAVPSDRIFAAGLSAGGGMAAILGVTHPDVFRAVGIHSGLPHGAAQDIPSAFSAMQGRDTGHSTPSVVPAIVFHGTADTTVAPANAARSLSGTGKSDSAETVGGRRTRVTRYPASGSELWLVEGAGHAWSGGSPAGTYTDAAGPDASTEMVRFFLALRN